MFLACDIGNSKIKAGLFKENNIDELYSFDTVEQIADIFSEKEISFTGISSVVPRKLKHLTDILALNQSPYHLISINSRLNLKVNYKTPASLGTDRICSAEGAFLLNGKMKTDEVVISVDFGTATTLNIIKYPGEFIGGVIAPGVEMMGEALHFHTAQLPKIGFSDFEGTIGDSTNSSIAGGLVNSAVGMIERVLNFIKSTEMTKKMKIYITGGNAENIIPHLGFEFVYEKNLVLYGIKAIIDLNLPG